MTKIKKKKNILPREMRPYRPCVGMMLLNREGLVFIAQRNDSSENAWQMPQGGIDPGEAPRIAAFRELREEIGTNNAELIHEADDWLRYDLPDDTIWGGRYRGQEQRWFVLRYLGTDSEINIATEHPEFIRWRWENIAVLPDLIVPFKRDLYQTLVARYTRLAIPYTVPI